MVSKFSNLRQLCLNSTCLAVAFGVAIVGASATAKADPMPTTSPFMSGFANAINSTTLKSFMDSDAPFTMYGITFYGTVDVALNEMNHGTDASPTFATAAGGMLQKNDANPTALLTHSGLEQSKLGLKGSEEIYDGFSAVFKLETALSPLSGELINGQKTLITQGYAANGKWPAGTTIMGDTSRDGQIFQGGAFGGISHSDYGTLTFGRHATPMLDLINAYDPQEGSNLFSPIGLSGAAAGMGDTQDARLDQSIKYNVKYGPARLAAIYQFSGTTNTTGGDDAYEANLGVDYGALSVDALVGLKRDAVNIANPATATEAASNLLLPTVSDNSTYAVFAKYDWKPVKVYGGYEHIHFTDPSHPLTAADSAGSSLGGYSYDFTTAAYTYAKVNSAYLINKNLHILWVGDQYSITNELKFDLAYYMYIQDNYSGVNNTACLSGNTAANGGAGNSGHCAGTEEFVSGVFDYRFNKRFDVYAGVMYTKADGGIYIANSYLHNNAVSSSAGLRFKF